MPNEANIRKVIEMIENEAHYFNMKRWGSVPSDALEAKPVPPNVCGTPSCIGGWTEAIMSFEKGLPRNIDLGSELTIKDEHIADWLGISEEQSDELFFPDLQDAYAAYNATREQAVAHLEYIIETGEVDWSRFVTVEGTDYAE